MQMTDYNHLTREDLEWRLRQAEAKLEDAPAAPADTSDRPEGVPPSWGTEGKHWFKKSTIGEGFQHPHLLDAETRDNMRRAMRDGRVYDDLDEVEAQPPRTAADFDCPEALIGSKPEPGRQYFYRASTIERLKGDTAQYEMHRPFLFDAVKHHRVLDDRQPNA